MTDSLGMSQSSPHTALRPVTVQYLVPGWTLRLQKSKGNSAQSKRKKIYLQVLTDYGSIHPWPVLISKYGPFSCLINIHCGLHCIFQSLPFSEVVNKVVPHLTTTTKKKEKRTGFSSSCQRTILSWWLFSWGCGIQSLSSSSELWRKRTESGMLAWLLQLNYQQWKPASRQA